MEERWQTYRGRFLKCRKKNTLGGVGGRKEGARIQANQLLFVTIIMQYGILCVKANLQQRGRNEDLTIKTWDRISGVHSPLPPGINQKKPHGGAEKK